MNPSFIGTIAGLSKANVGLGNVNDTSDAGKLLSTAATTALAGKAPVFDLGTGLQWTSVLGPGNLILNATGSVSEASAGALFLKADKANPTFTGEATAANLTVNGNLTMAQPGTSLTVKRIQAAPSSNLELSGVVSASGYVNLTGGASIVNPSFSGTITGLSKANVDLPRRFQ